MKTESQKSERLKAYELHIASARRQKRAFNVKMLRLNAYDHRPLL